MAILKNNHLLAGLSGKVGNFVLKQLNGKTIMCAVPNKSHVKATKQQKANRLRFKKAIAYAKVINDDPEKRKLYLKKLKKGDTVFRFAMREFFKGGG